MKSTALATEKKRFLLTFIVEFTFNLSHKRETRKTTKFYAHTEHTGSRVETNFFFFFFFFFFFLFFFFFFYCHTLIIFTIHIHTLITILTLATYTTLRYLSNAYIATYYPTITLQSIQFAKHSISRWEIKVQSPCTNPTSY